MVVIIIIIMIIILRYFGTHLHGAIMQSGAICKLTAVNLSYLIAKQPLILTHLFKGTHNTFVSVLYPLSSDNGYVQ
jgi:hypothetical protein